MPKILVIEDEEILRDEMVAWLLLEDYEALAAADGAAGVELAFRQLPDLIVCDITMPRLDGYGVLMEIHANPATARVPFIFVTARASHEDIRRGMSLGADDYITKPFTRQELLQAIQARLAKKSAQEQEQLFQVEQLRQALAQEHEQYLLKTKLVAMFSHDFRNPLTSILMSNSLLREHADRMDAQRRLLHLNRIDAAVRQLVQMLDDILLVAQMEIGNLALKLEWLNIGEFTQHIVEDFQTNHSEDHPIYFENQVAAPIWSDARLVRQIVTNLLSNAIKYSIADAPVLVNLTCQAGQCQITVQDHGIGIPEADQKLLFSIFQRGSNVGEISGTGLGLAIVKQSVDLLGGQIQVESEVGQGTTARVIFPAQAPQANPPL